MNEQHWEQEACPKYDCRKENCKCGMKRVFLATALGDDSEDSPIAPKNGAYCNAIVVYEANGHVYIYSSEGIPTMMSADVAGLEELEEAIRNAQSDIVELDGDLLEETRNRESGDGALQEEIDAIKNSPDVVDIVATYAALQTYDTSKLGDNDIVRVLADEQHDGASTYYRWNKQSSTWTYIGEVGDYYTKGQVDALLADKQDELTAGENISIVEDGGSLVISALGNVRVLTTDDYNYPENNPSGIGIWKLETGVYRTEGSVNVYPHTGTLIIPSKHELLFVSGKSAYVYTMRYNGAKTMAMFSADRTTGVGQDEGSIFSNSLVVDNLTSTSTSDPLSANQGKTLKDMIDGLIISGAGAPTTSTVGTIGQLYEDTTNGKLYQCTSTSGGTYTWSEVGGGGGGGGDIVYSTKTTSNSADGGAVYIGGKNANQDIYPDPTVTDNHWHYFWALPFNPEETAYTDVPGNETLNIGGSQSTGGDHNVTIGFRSRSAGSGNVAIGYQAGSNQAYGSAVSVGASAQCFQNYGVALGKEARVNQGHTGSIALGAGARTTRQGEVYVGTNDSFASYNSSKLRVIGGVYDGQDIHDAATVAQGNTLSTSAPDSSTVGVLGQLWTDTTNMHTYQCTAISGSTYTWTQRW